MLYLDISKMCMNGVLIKPEDDEEIELSGYALLITGEALYENHPVI